MIKTNKILALSFTLLLMFFVNSCVEDDDYNTPDLTIAPVDLASLGEFTSFSNIVSRYDVAVANGEQVGVFSVENDAPLYTIGYVVSDDVQGNFYEEIFIQNTTDGNDPSNDVRRGLKVDIDASDLGGFYNFGRKVYIKLNGLAIGFENGVYTLGKSQGNSQVQILEPEMKNFIIRDPETAVITPKQVAMEDLERLDESTYMEFSNSQFIKSDKFKTYADEASDQYDGFRTIMSCDSNASLVLQTSTFADFKSAQVAQGKGAISGVYTRDYGDDFSVLVVNKVQDIQFDDMNRCDPEVLECTGPIGSANTVFSENFESFGTYASEGWTMTNVQGGDVDWFISSFSGNYYSRISAYNSDETSDVWLVTPVINLDSSTEEALNFDIQASYDNGTNLTVYISQDFAGDVSAATWVTIDAAIPSGPSNTFGNFETVGPINISCLDGDVHFAFVYSGSDPGATTRYHLDNVNVVSSN